MSERCPNCGAPLAGKGYPAFVKWACGSYSKWEQSNECIRTQEKSKEVLK